MAIWKWGNFRHRFRQTLKAGTEAKINRGIDGHNLGQKTENC